MSSNYFVYTGNAYPHKNLNNLIKAIVLLNKNKKEKIKLKIISGRNVFIDRLEKFVELNDAKSLVEILGFKNDDEIKDIYKNSIAFIFPTLEEGFGLPPMEAINAGTLAVVSDIPVLKEVYENSVMYFNPRDINSIKQSMENVLEMSREEREKRIKEAQKYLKKYSWLKMAKETLKIYNLIYGI